MLSYKYRESIVRLDALDGDIEVSIRQEHPWDRRNKKESDKSLFRISVYFVDDTTYNCLELATDTLEEAKLVAEDAVRFMKTNRPVLSIQKEELDSKD